MVASVSYEDCIDGLSVVEYCRGGLEITECPGNSFSVAVLCCSELWFVEDCINGLLVTEDFSNRLPVDACCIVLLLVADSSVTV